MIGVARKFQNVPLRNAHVFQHLPGGVGKTIDQISAFFHRKVSDKFIEADVRIAAIEQRDQLFTHRLVVRGLIHGVSGSILSVDSVRIIPADGGVVTELARLSAERRLDAKVTTAHAVDELPDTGRDVAANALPFKVIELAPAAPDTRAVRQRGPV